MADEQRKSNAGPPTLLVQSYDRMGHDGRKRLRKIGSALLLCGVGMPMTIEPFIPLSWVYWTFSGFVSLVGLVFIWPEAGIWLFGAIPNVLARFWPKGADALKPERRAPRDEEGTS